MNPELQRIFQEAFVAGSDFAKADKAWSRAIELDPSNSAAWSNRGTLRLQFSRWEAAATDLQRAADLDVQEKGQADALVLNNLVRSELDASACTRSIDVALQIAGECQGRPGRLAGG